MCTPNPDTHMSIGPDIGWCGVSIAIYPKGVLWGGELDSCRRRPFEFFQTNLGKP